MPEPSIIGRTASPIERERAVVTGLFVLLLLLWVGFAVHRSPQFPGSLLGTLLGIAGAILMVLPSLTYTAVKRLPDLKQRLPLRRLLTWHLWAGMLGSVLAILHSGHRFESTLGIALTGVMLIVIFSGYVGRHFLNIVSLELREKQAILEKLVASYNELTAEIASRPQVEAAITKKSPWTQLSRRIGLSRSPSDPETYLLARRATELAGSIADLEYAIKTHELMKGRFTTWLAVHIGASLTFYGLLGLHIWASFYFGLRWLS